MQYIQRLEKRLALRGDERNVQRAKEDQATLTLLTEAIKEKDERIKALEMERKYYLEDKFKLADIIELQNKEIASLHGDKDVWHHDITEGVEKTKDKVDKMEMNIDMAVVGINNTKTEMTEEMSKIAAQMLIANDEVKSDILKEINNIKTLFDVYIKDIMTKVNYTPPNTPNKRARLVVETIPQINGFTPGTYYNASGRIDVVE